VQIEKRFDAIAIPGNKESLLLPVINAKSKKSIEPGHTLFFFADKELQQDFSIGM
jgi:hypothetical protein